MPPIINVQGISKAFGANPLFQNVSFTVTEGDRIGLIGPNGSGKSTLLRILAGDEDPDSGEIAFRKRLRVSYVEQDSRFKSGATVRSVAEERDGARPRSTRRSAARALPKLWAAPDFEDLDAEAASSVRRMAKAPGDRRGAGAGAGSSCCSTNPPIIWISQGSSGSKGCSRKLRLPA